LNEDGIEVWRGGVATWECDVMGHLNVGFYVAKCQEGLAGLAAALGMPKAFTPNAQATLVVRELHVRFLREARPSQVLSMTAGVIAIGETDARLLFLLRHADGQLSAAFSMTVAHVTAREGRAFPWPERVRARAVALEVVAPAQALPRGLRVEPFDTRASIGRAESLGLTRIAMGALGPGECDVFGRMRPEVLISRISSGVPRLLQAVDRPAVTNDGKRMGGAVVEYRMVYLAPGGVGGQFEIRSAFVGGDTRSRRLIHWMLDADSGQPWGVAEAVAVSLDLDTRRITNMSQAALDALSPHFVADLTL
jgi:acyl-CoA thioester hydrolase